ncbi:Ras-related protein Rab-10 [Balamuthia mandrillaris]
MKKGGLGQSRTSSAVEDVLSLCRNERLHELKRLVERKKASRKVIKLRNASNHDNANAAPSSSDTAPAPLLLSPLEHLLLHSDPTEGRGLLHLAATEDQRKVVRFLLSLRHDQKEKNDRDDKSEAPKLVDHQDVAGWTALHAAASQGHLHTCLMLLEEGQAAAHLTTFGDANSALHYLMKRSYPKEQKALLRRVITAMREGGADVNALNVNQETALHLACWKGDRRSASLLLEAGASMVLFNKTGETCLHYAVRNGHAEVVRLLVANGADVSAVGNNGSASDIARECRYFPIADYIDSFLTIRRLPDEVLLHCFKFLTNVKDLLHTTQVCKHFRRIGSEPILWEPFLALVTPSKLKEQDSNNDSDWKQAYLDHRKHLREQQEQHQREKAERYLLRRAYAIKTDFATKGFHYLMKLFILGDAGVGKTSITQRIVEDTYTDSYMPWSDNFKAVILDVNNFKVNVQIWELDMRGRWWNNFHSRVYHGTCGVILCYDVSLPESFDNIPYVFWILFFREIDVLVLVLLVLLLVFLLFPLLSASMPNQCFVPLGGRNFSNWNCEVDRYTCGNLFKLMLATKVDLPPDLHRVHPQQARELAEDCAMEFVETSAKENTNVREAFQAFVTQILTRKLEEDESNGSTSSSDLSAARKKKPKKFFFF